MSAPQPYDTYLYGWLQLVAVLREVHYMESRSYENVPAGALELYARRDELRNYVINLELSVLYCTTR